MASDFKIQDQEETSFKCRLCRQVLFSSANVYMADNESGRPGNTVPVPGQDQPRAGGVLWYISDSAIPPWIQSAVEQAQWTKGKLACPKCRGRLGSFDFLTPSIRYCADRPSSWSCIQINGSRVDREASQSLLAYLRRGNQSQVKGQASPMSSLEPDPVESDAGSLEDRSGALPAGCWYLNSSEMDTKQLSPAKFDPNLRPNKFGTKDLLDLLEMEKQESPPETPKASNVKPPSRASDIPCTPNGGDSFAVGKSSSAQVNQPANRNLPCNGDLQHGTIKHIAPCLQSSEQLSVNSEAGLEPGLGFGQLDHTENIHVPRRAGANAAHDAIQFGFGNLAKHGRTSCEVSNNSNASLTEEKSDDATLSMPRPSPTRSAPDAPKRPIATQYSNANGQSGQTDSVWADSGRLQCTSSSETWQGVLDELLVDLDRERGGASEWTGSGRDDISQREEVLDTDSRRSGCVAGSRGVSSYLQRAVQRAQKRERNKRKNARRKLRRRERWMTEQTEQQELLNEEKNLACDAERLLLGTPEASGSSREALTCPVCLDLYLNPHRCLPCRHVFCEPCLRRLAHTTQSGVTVPCPLCRAVVLEAKPQAELTTAIDALFPRLIAHRKQAERKHLNKAYPLPGHHAPTSLTSWISRNLAGNNRNGLHHWRGRGRRERTTVGLIMNMAWKLASVLVLMISLTVLSVGYFLAVVKYS